jgi:hypothetical protein
MVRKRCLMMLKSVQNKCFTPISDTQNLQVPYLDRGSLQFQLLRIMSICWWRTPSAHLTNISYHEPRKNMPCRPKSKSLKGFVPLRSDLSTKRATACPPAHSVLIQVSATTTCLEGYVSLVTYHYYPLRTHPFCLSAADTSTCTT